MSIKSLLIKRWKSRPVSSGNFIYIESIKGLKNQVMVKTTTEDKLVNTSLKQLKTELEKYAYFLLLKSYCINLSQLQKIDSAHYVLEFFNGDSLLVGRKIFEKTKERFHDFQKNCFELMNKS